MSKKGVAYKASLDIDQVSQHLQSLRDCLREGKICLQVGDESIVLDLDTEQQLELELSGTRKKNKNKLSIELSWVNAAPLAEDQPAILIASQPPEPEPEPEDQDGAEAEEPEDQPA